MTGPTMEPVNKQLGFKLEHAAIVSHADYYELMDVFLTWHDECVLGPEQNFSQPAKTYLDTMFWVTVRPYHMRW